MATVRNVGDDACDMVSWLCIDSWQMYCRRMALFGLTQLELELELLECFEAACARWRKSAHHVSSRFA